MIASNPVQNGRLTEADFPVSQPAITSMESTPEFDPTEILHSLRRNGVTAALISLPLAALAFAAAFLGQPEVFRASALLQISSTQTNLVFEGGEASDFEIFQGTQKELVRTRLVMTSALRNMSESSVLHMDRPVDWMLKNVGVSTPEQTEVMTVSVTASNDANPIEIVNATVDAYMVEVVNRERDAKQRRLSGIESILDQKQTEVRRKRNELKQLAEQLGSGDSETLSIRQQLLVQELGYLRRQLIELRSKQSSIRAEIRSLQAAQSSDSEVEKSSESGDENEGESHERNSALPGLGEINEALAGDRIYVELMRDKISTFRADHEAESAFKTGFKSPYTKVQTQIDEAMKERRRQITEELTALAPLRQQVTEQKLRTTLDRRIGQLRAESEVNDEMQSQLESDESALMQEFKQVGNQSIDVEMMRSEIVQLDAVLASVAQQREELKVELQSRPRVEVLRKASELEPADKMKRVGFAGFAGLLSFLLPFSLVLGVDLFGKRVSSSRSVVAKSGLPLIGTIPELPRSAIKRLNETHRKKSQYWRGKLNEAVRRVASALLSQPRFDSEDGDSTVVLITSAVRGEGKTTLATQLASSLAGTNRTVILCDFDLRRPKLHQSLGVSLEKGVCEVLRGDTDLKSAIQETDEPGLSVLTAGQCCENAINALSDELASPLISELRMLADVIVIDSGPVLSSADVSYCSLFADQVVFAVRRDFSRVADVTRATHLLPMRHDQSYGAVVIEACSDAMDQAFERFKE